MFRTLFGTLLVLLIPWLAAGGEPVATRVMVRAIAKDAKIIGTGVGGVRVTIREVSNGRILAQGMAEGKTGDTNAIMVEPRARDTAVFDTPGASGYLATLALSEPTVVEIIAEGPLGTPQSVQRASKTLLLVPGRDVVGDGVILEIHGFTVEILDGSGPLRRGDDLAVRARVTMTWGCPTEPGGLWDADKIDVVARIARRGRVVDEVPLEFSGEQSIYTGVLRLEHSGTLELRVLAMQADTANFGITRQRIKVRY